MTERDPFPEGAVASTRKAGREVDEGDGRVFPCPQCGADLLFHIGQQKMNCPYCGYFAELTIDDEATVEEQDFHAMLEQLREWKEEGHSAGELGEKEVRCDGCGGNIVFTGTLTSSECPYCATPIQREKIHDAPHRIPVDAVLPFLVDERSGRKKLVAWISSRWFAPNDFLKKAQVGKFSGVYLPYWTFDSMTFTRYTGRRGENYTVTVGTGKNRRTETRTRWYPASGAFQRFFDDVVVMATKGLDRKLILELEPWPLGRAIPFNQEVMAGYLARTYDTGLDEGFHEAEDRMENVLRGDVRRRIGGDRQQITSMKVAHSAITFKHVLLPIWILAYQYKEQTYQVIINGGTGEVQGHRPYSWVKITFAILLGMLIVGGLVFLSQR